MKLLPVELYEAVIWNNTILVLEHYMKLSPGELFEAVFWRECYFSTRALYEAVTRRTI